MPMNETTSALAKLLVERCGWRMWKDGAAWYAQRGPGERVYHLNGDPDMTQEALISILEEMPTKPPQLTLKQAQDAAGRAGPGIEVREM